MTKTDWRQAEGRVVKVASMYTRGQLTVVFTYRVEDELYEGKYYTFDSIHEGDSLIVRYDPLNPKRNNVETKHARIKRIAFAVAVSIAVAVLFLVWFSVQR